MNELEKILEAFIKLKDSKIKTVNLSNNEKYLSIKEKSINIIEKGEKIDDTWMNYAQSLSRSGYLPIESYIALAKQLNQSNYLDDKTTELKVYLLNDYIIDSICDNISFNLNKVILQSFIAKLYVSNNNSHKKRIITEKILKSKKIVVNNCNKDVISLIAKINNINKAEHLTYYSKLNNYYYLPNENIDFFNLNSGELVAQIKEKPEDIIRKSSYQLFCEYLFQSKEEIDLSKELHRIFHYQIAKDFATGRDPILHIGEVREDILNSLLTNEDLFSKTYIEAIFKNTSKDNFTKSIEILEENPTEETLKRLILKYEDVERIFEILKIAPTIMTEDISIETYIDAIIRCSEIDSHNIKIALFCEELLVDKPIIIDGIVDFLKDMYSKQVYTDNTIKILDYLRCTIKDSSIIEETLVRIKANNEIWDNDFLEKFLKVYEISNDKSSFDEVINKMINSKELLFNNSLIKVFYDFYKRNNDVHSLNKLMIILLNRKSNISLIGMNINDAVKLIKLNNRLNVEGKEYYLLNIISEFKHSMKVQKEGIKILERIYKNENDNILRQINNVYWNLIEVLKDHSEIIYNNYIRHIITLGGSYLLENDYIVDELSNIIDKNIEFEVILKLKVLSILIDYYCLNENYEKALDIIQIYFSDYLKEDEGKVFRELLTKQYKSFEFIELILRKIDFSAVQNTGFLLNLIGRDLIDNEKYELIPEILRYYSDNLKYDESYFILERYIKSVDFIDEITYSITIEDIFENLDHNKKKTLYDFLINRNDFPIELRVKYYDFNKSKLNTQNIINAFEDRLTLSALAKWLSLEHYYDNNDKFLKLSKTGEDDQNVINIFWKKIKEQFKDDKFFVEELINDKLCRDEDFRRIKEHANNYSENIFDDDNKNVFGEFYALNKVSGEVCDELELEHVFDFSKLTAIFIKDHLSKSILYRYFDKLSLTYYEIDENTMVISEENNNDFIYDGDLLNLLKGIVNLISLQIELISNSMLMLDFTKNSFIINERGFVPQKFSNIIKYTGEFNSRDLHLFKNITEIRVKNKYVTINEKNILIIMQKYITQILMKRNDEEKSLLLKRKVIESIILNNEIETLENFLNNLITFIDNESKEFDTISYRQMLKKYDGLSMDEKTIFVNKAIVLKDTTPSVKKKVLTYIDTSSSVENNDSVDNYSALVYLLECFNNAHMELTTEDFCNIYSIINHLLLNNKFTLSDEDKNQISNCYINAKKLCKFRPIDVKKDFEELEILNDERAYILSRL